VNFEIMLRARVIGVPVTQGSMRVTKDYPDSVTELHSPGVVIHIAAISTEGARERPGVDQ
jgi:hypothetical protein